MNTLFFDRNNIPTATKVALANGFEWAGDGLTAEQLADVMSHRVNFDERAFDYGDVIYYVSKGSYDERFKFIDDANEEFGEENVKIHDFGTMDVLEVKF